MAFTSHFFKNARDCMEFGRIQPYILHIPKRQPILSSFKAPENKQAVFDVAIWHFRINRSGLSSFESTYIPFVFSMMLTNNILELRCTSITVFNFASRFDQSLLDLTSFIFNCFQYNAGRRPLSLR